MKFFKKQIRRLFVIVLIFTLLCSSVLPVYALENANVVQSVLLPSNIIHISDVDPRGADWDAETIIDNTLFTQNYTLSNRAKLVEYSDGMMHVTFNADGDDVKIEAYPIGRTESGKTVFYECRTSTEKYEVALFELATDTLHSYTYTDKVQKLNIKEFENKSCVKIYLRDKTSCDLSFLFIEIFDYDYKLDEDILESLIINPLLGAWGMNYFQATSESLVETPVSTYSLTSSLLPDNKYFTCTKTFNWIGESTTHTMTWLAHCTPSNVSVGQDSRQRFQITITGKTSTYELHTDLNSTTASFLHMTDLNLSATTPKNTAWVSSKIDGLVQDVISLDDFVDFSAGISFCYDYLSVSVSIPSLFTYLDPIDVDETYEFLANGVNENYYRSINVALDNDYDLTQIGHNFYVELTLHDFGNQSGISDYLRARWVFTITNANNFTTCTHNCSHSFALSIN